MRMRREGYAVQQIAGWLNINSGRVSEIMNGKYPSLLPCRLPTMVKWFKENLDGVLEIPTQSKPPKVKTEREDPASAKGHLSAPEPNGVAIKFKVRAYELWLKGLDRGDPAMELIGDLITALEERG